ncbi:MAG: hypothetical protein ABR981_01450 [Candidatus Micrarchaeaceae archaeon]|jgi:hypothetical protein
MYGKTIYLQGMQSIIGSGATSEAVTPPKIEGLIRLGTRRLRLMNVDGNTLQSIAADGTQTLQWPVTLTYPLKLCKQNHWIPHIIIGNVVPAALAKVDASGRKYGPTSWDSYDKYINAFIKYVVVDQGFAETEWEVGNEMNSASENWAADEKPKATTDEYGFNAYAVLYSHIAKDIDEFRHQNPNVHIRVGGPAEGYNNQVAPPLDWTTRFVRYNAANNMPMDFVSFHTYGNSVTSATLGNLIGEIRKELVNVNSAASIFITEWGPSYEATPGLNYEPISGAFALDFVAKMALFGVHDTIFLSLSKFPTLEWPALYKLDGSPSHIMLALLSIMDLKGAAVPCVGTDGASGVAVKDANGNIDVVFWNFNWETDKFPTVMPAKGESTHTFVMTEANGNWTGNYDLVEAKLNSESWEINAQSPFANCKGSELTFSLVLPYGSYGYLQLTPHV